MSRIFCIGRNYQDHIAELKNDIPDDMVVFIKPISSISKNNYIPYPKHGSQLQQETELVIKLGNTYNENNPLECIDKFAVGIDFTLRDIQSKLKSKGLPWEKAKSFENSASISEWIKFDAHTHDLNNIDITCEINDVKAQDGNTKKMIYSVETILSNLSSIWNLQNGDIIFTGTPKGVCNINIGDKITISMPQYSLIENFHIIK